MLDLWLSEATVPITNGTWLTIPAVPNSNLSAFTFNKPAAAHMLKVSTSASGTATEVWIYDGDPASPQDSAFPRKGRLVEHFLTTGLLAMPVGVSGRVVYSFYSGVWVRVAGVAAHIGIYTSGNPNPKLGI